jgi:hypothetical protein
MSAKVFSSLAVVLSLFAAINPAHAAGPWGMAQELDIIYPPANVVFDVTAGSEAELTNILDRVSMLNNFYASDPLDAKIVVVLHGEAIPYFTIANYRRHRALMERAASVTHGEIVEFRLCRAAAKARYGLGAKDIHGFVKMVPMADAEIIRLQRQGFAYMQ